MFINLIRQCIKPLSESSIKKESPPFNDSLMTTNDLDPLPTLNHLPLVGFVYAPTTAHDNSSTHWSPQNSLQTSSKPSSDNITNFRRGSKDSSDSFSSGLTVDAIIDRLITPDVGRNDEQIIPIFMIFFRKFMKPSELVYALIERFENDLCRLLLPTRQQERIAQIFAIWMTDYWSDFIHSKTRNQMYLFLDRISAMELSSLQPILDILRPLSLQSPPDDDLDNFWGKTDDDDDDDDAIDIIHNKKKDSGYMSLHFGNQYRPHYAELLDELYWKQLSSTIDETSPSVYASCSTPTSSQRSSISSLTTTPPKSSMSASVSKLSTTLSTPQFVSETISTKSSPLASPNKTHHTSLAPSLSTCSGSPTHALTMGDNKSSYQNKSIHLNTKGKATTKISSSATTKLTRPEFAGGLISMDSFSRSSSIASTSRSPIRRNMKSYTPPPHSMTPVIPNTPIPSLATLYSLSERSLPTPTIKSPSYVAIGSLGNNNSKLHKTYKWKNGTMCSTNYSSQMANDVSVKDYTKMFFSLSDQEIAEQLTWIEGELFANIKSREFVRMIWANNDIKQHQHRRQSMASSTSDESQSDPSYLDKNEKQTTATRTKSDLLASISHFNFISAWVISMMVSQPKFGKRVAILEKFMSIAVVLRDLNNYNTLMAILAGVNNAAILRMKHTQVAIKKKKAFKRFQSLEKLMSSDRSYCSYRMALKASTDGPCIPYLGIHSQDLIALTEANKDMKTDGTIHWEKFRLMGDCIMTILKLQQPRHNIKPNEMILSWIADCKIASEEDQYVQSIQIEPRLKTSSMTRLRELWSRK
ncbi:ras guanine nucleotide exchange factor domain-containing protein [Halteromyces radiatus]|uniref:ras guanine nucleotide exchange factor domain-containing protein n=1 Tax=Halteromyces radiatus TaxID=101107 RepID=UPI00221ECF56|nr:ras guanine nucleotide exchange factor domain-containing protein [Halteromyces radiatus]KAI8097128.1 ras guanine nucleotide exchange factor domain-containing protein [Halteromyces radiatus]